MMDLTGTRFDISREDLKSVPPPLSGHDSRDWSESVNVIGVICEPFVVNEESE